MPVWALIVDVVAPRIQVLVPPAGPAALFVVFSALVLFVRPSKRAVVAYAVTSATRIAFVFPVIRKVQKTPSAVLSDSGVAGKEVPHFPVTGVFETSGGFHG